MAKKKNKILNYNPPYYILPSDNSELESFIKEFKIDMMEQVVSSIEHAVGNNLNIIEVFQFKNSDFVITISEKDYLVNLDNIFNYYIKNEMFEYCPRITRLQKILQNKSTDEKQKQ